MSGKMFLIDDEDHITHSLVRELADWGASNNVSFYTFNNPLRVLEALKENSDVFLVISDLRMPEMLGSDLLLEIHKLYPEIITILLTGYSEVEEIMKAIKAGIFSYILKPWDEKYLLTEVNKALELFTIKKERRKYIEMLDEELRWGGELQKKLLTREPPASDKVSFSVEYMPLPKLYCGGDYYDVIQLPEDRYLVLLGDVAGHGLKAAFITTILKTIIYSGYIKNHKDDENFSPAGFLFWLNKRVSKELSQFPDMLITFIILFLDIPGKRIVFSNAGQPEFFLIRNGKYFSISEEGICLNITDKPVYRNKAFNLKSGDSIFLFTDGLTEITRDKTALPEEKIGPVFLNAVKNDFEVKKIIEEFKKQSSDNCFYDDVTLLSIRIL